MWHFILEEFPRDEPVTLAVLDPDGFHTLEFPCRRTDDGRWVDAKTGFTVDVRPTHWREWHSDTHFGPCSMEQHIDVCLWLICCSDSSACVL